MLQTIGERLAGLRLARYLTPEQVAEEAGLGLRTLQRLESGATATSALPTNLAEKIGKSHRLALSAK